MDWNFVLHNFGCFISNRLAVGGSKRNYGHLSRTYPILRRKFFINISETMADRQKVWREMLFTMTTLTTYVKVIEIRESSPNVNIYFFITKVEARYIGRWLSWGALSHHTVGLPRCSFSQRFLTRCRSISLSPSQNKSESEVVGIVPSFWCVGQTELSA